jgi:thiamine pyrophosphate-dependent acetolactate synthase large subunit-like protein
MAAFMAVAHAKFTGEIGVCLSTGGPGATHLITGLYDAKLDHAPVLAICGQADATVRGASYQQELNLDRMFADVAVFAQEAFQRTSRTKRSRTRLLHTVSPGPASGTANRRSCQKTLTSPGQRKSLMLARK